jgi:hypothetical protein
LYKWRSLSSQSDDKAKNWVLVTPAQEPEPPSQTEVSIELTLPNQSIARLKVLRTEAVSFFQELYHAIAVIR